MIPHRRHGARVLPAISLAAVAGIAALVLSFDLRPTPRQGAVLPGLTVEDTGVGSGIIVTSVQSASPAARAGIAVGDRITAFDGHPVAGLGAAKQYLQGDTRPVIDIDLYHHHAVRDVRLVRSEDPQNVPQDTGGRG